MLPNTFFSKEIIEDLKGRRAMAIKMVLPLVLIVPLAFGNFDPGMKAGIFLAMAIFMGVFGSAVGFVRFRESKMMERMQMLPIASWRLASDYVFSNALMDFVQLVVPLLLLLAFINVGIVFWILATVSFVSLLVVANSIGLLVAFLAKTSGEVHLFSILAVLLLALLGGGFGFFSIPLWISKAFPFSLFVRAVSGTATVHEFTDALLSVLSALFWISIPLLLMNRVFYKR